MKPTRTSPRTIKNWLDYKGAAGICTLLLADYLNFYFEMTIFFLRAHAEFVKSAAQDTFKDTNGGNNKNIVMYTYVVATDDVLSWVKGKRSVPSWFTFFALIGFLPFFARLIVSTRQGGTA